MILRANKEIHSWATKVDLSIMLQLLIIMTRKVNLATERAEIKVSKMAILLDLKREQKELIKEFTKVHKELMIKSLAKSQALINMIPLMEQIKCLILFKIMVSAQVLLFRQEQ